MSVTATNVREMLGAVDATYLLRALAALVLGGMIDLVAITAAAAALGVLEIAVGTNQGLNMVDPIIGAVIFVALIVLRRRRSSRVYDAALRSDLRSRIRSSPDRPRSLPSSPIGAVNRACTPRPCLYQQRARRVCAESAAQELRMRYRGQRGT